MATDIEMDAERDAEIAAAGAVPTQAFDVVVIGGGPAGMAAALAAHKAGARVAIVERERAHGRNPPPVHSPGLWSVAL